METLGKYEIREELGRGGFGTVYRALDTTLKREVALKVLNPALLHEAGWLARFQREAQFIAALEHPRIVTVYEIAEAENRVFIAMKLLRGPSLDKVLAERGALPWEKAQRITLEVAEALAYAHAQGVLHRDLKPANIVLDAAMGAVLTDFGFARLMGDTSLSLSVSGGLVGTPHYIAPELWQNQPASPASDLYALGCILYEMVLGRKAFPGDTSPAVMMAHFQPLALPEAWTKGTPPRLTDVLQGALAQAPEARTPTLAAFVGAVSALQVDPLAEPYAALERAMTAGDWEKARQLAEAIHAQNPAYRETAQALEKAKAEIARAELIAQWRVQTEAALRNGQWMAARAAAEQWLRLAPGDARAQAVVAQINATVVKPTPQPVAEWITHPKSEPIATSQAQPVLQPLTTAIDITESEPIREAQTDAAKKLHWTFVLWWLLASTLGWAVGLAVGWPVGEAVVGAVVGTVLGTVVGILQWWILKAHLHKVGWWILASAVGCSVVWTVVGAVDWAVGSAVVGAVIGILQWWILKAHLHKAGWWILANALGWVVMFTVTSAMFDAAPLVVPLAGAVIGIITGPVLFWLLKNPKTIVSE